MKNILITGKGSYIGTHFKEYMKQWPDQYQVDELDMMDPAWEDHDFSKYDVVIMSQGWLTPRQMKASETFIIK